VLDGIDNAFELSEVQQGMLYHCVASPHSDTYVSYIQAIIPNQLDTTQWRHAWDCVCKKHEALRTSFLWDGLDSPLQVVHNSVQLKWHIADLTKLSNQGQLETLSDYLAKERTFRIEPQDNPPMRFALHKLSDNRWHFLWSIHHLIADGWSTPIILQEVLNFYSQQIEVPVAKSSSFANYLQWQKNRDNKVATKWWSNLLQNREPTPIQFPPVPTAVSHSKNQNEHPETQTISIPMHEWVFNSEQTQALNIFCQSSNITISTLVHVAWALCVANYSGNRHPLFGTTVSGRHPEFQGADSLVGLCLTTLPFTLALKNNDQIGELLQVAHAQMFNVTEYDNVPIQDLYRHLDSDGTTEPIESIVVVESHNNDLKIENPEKTISIDEIDYTTHSHFPLALLVFPGNCLKLRLVFNDQIDTHAADSILRLFTQYCQAILENPDCSVDYLLNYPNQQAKNLQNGCTVTNQYTRMEHWIEACAHASPDAIALIDKDQTVNYQSLNQSANQVAQMILETVPTRACGIGIYLDKGPGQITTLLGILKAGHYYVPLDKDAPIQQTQTLLKNASIDYVFGTNSESVNFDIPSTWLYLDHAINEQSHYSRSKPEVAPENSSKLAYVIFTSGSTGTPKGVQISHQNLIYSTSARLNYYGTEPCRFLLLSSLSFDSSVAGIYWSLCSSGTLVIPRAGEEKDLEILQRYIDNYQVTHTLCLPRLYELILDHIPYESLKSLQVCIVAGESCQPKVVEKHFSILEHAALYNEYGPTESTVWSSVHACEKENQLSVPIGKAIPGTTVLIENLSGYHCAPNAVGEIVIQSPGVSSGYFEQPEATNIAFRVETLNKESTIQQYKTGDLGYTDRNGLIYCLGRKDKQLNINGYRIEPAEIEQALIEIEGIKESVVFASSTNKLHASTHELIAALNKLPDSTALAYIEEAEQWERDKTPERPDMQP